MSAILDQRILTRRLERLRAGDGPRGSTADRSGRRLAAQATDLAAALGGRTQGAIAIFEHELPRPLDQRALSRLPVPVEEGRPVVLLDLETTGLATAAGTLAFVVGIGTWRANTLVVRQLLLPDHAAESELLAALEALLPPDACLVTYNGRCFDWPLLVARYRLHGRAAPALGQHVDLLPLSRQVWRARLGSARLAAVEQAVCGVERVDDLPGALIPSRYFGYLRHRRPGSLRAVVEHNRQDIVSLAGVLAALARLVADAGCRRAAHPLDLLGLGRALARRQRLADALECIEAGIASPAWQQGVSGGGPVWRRLAIERAVLLGRLGRRDDQYAAWLQLADRGGPGAAAAWLQVARHRERHLRDVEGALEACRRAAAASAVARLWGRSALSVERDLAARMARLNRRRLGARVSLPAVDRWAA
jgi:uncharacterized protein